ncbi:hypothetical protein GCM10009547_36770 [Sporichthya brevicatena]|uniref:PRC-barrel domain-containing protein n=1 Tax=Sporichthya brevicatena TaxID=171442 RepID=A0ABN1H5T3_9ACTN
MPDSSVLKGQPLVDADGETVGRIDDVYVDPGSGRAEFLEVRTSRFRRKRHLVPLTRINVAGGAVTVPYPREKIVEAPLRPRRELTADDEALLRDYWHLPAVKNRP